MPRPPTANLRATLVQQALALVEERGVDDVNLRDLAERAGVSRQASYLHFPDRRALLASVAAEGFGRLRRAMEAGLDGDTTDAPAALRTIAEVYVGFAGAHPHLVALMLGPYVAKGDSPELQAEAIELFALLRELCGRCPRPCTDVLAARRRTVLFQSAVVGVLTLGAHRQIPPSVGASVSELVREAVDTLLRGWAAEPGGGAP